MGGKDVDRGYVSGWSAESRGGHGWSWVSKGSKVLTKGGQWICFTETCRVVRGCCPHPAIWETRALPDHPQLGLGWSSAGW